MIFQHSEHSIDNFDHAIDEISVLGCKLDFGPTYLHENPENELEVGKIYLTSNFMVKSS